jgi:hypothetical protein
VPADSETFCCCILTTAIGDRSGRLVDSESRACQVSSSDEHLAGASIVVVHQIWWYHCLQELDRVKCSDQCLVSRRHKDEFDARESLVLPCRDFLSVLTDFGMD